MGSGGESHKMKTTAMLNTKSNSAIEPDNDTASKGECDHSEEEDINLEDLKEKTRQNLKKNVLYELNQSIINMHKNQEQCVVTDVNVTIELYLLDLSS